MKICLRYDDGVVVVVVYVVVIIFRHLLLTPSFSFSLSFIPVYFLVSNIGCNIVFLKFSNRLFVAVVFGNFVFRPGSEKYYIENSSFIAILLGCGNAME